MGSLPSLATVVSNEICYQHTTKSSRSPFTVVLRKWTGIALLKLRNRMRAWSGVKCCLPRVVAGIEQTCSSYKLWSNSQLGKQLPANLCLRTPDAPSLLPYPSPQPLSHCLLTEKIKLRFHKKWEKNRTCWLSRLASHAQLNNKDSKIAGTKTWVSHEYLRKCQICRTEDGNCWLCI